MSTENTNGNGGGTALMERPPQQVPVARREIRVVEDSGPLANLMDTARFEHLQRIANLMANSSLLPDHLSGDKQGLFPRDVVAANCFRVVNQALRWGFDPFAIVDETYMVKGKLGYQGKLVAAVVNARAKLQSRLSYAFSGSGADRTVTVSAVFEEETEPRTAQLRLGDAKTDNQMWTKDPDQKLIYSGVVKWARRHCPEVVLGVLTDDDIDRMQASTKELEHVPRTPATSLAERLAEAPAADVIAKTTDGHRIDRPNLVTDPDEQERILREAAEKARANNPQPLAAAPAQDAGSPTQQQAPTAGGGAEWPIELSEASRTSTTFIEDAILHFKPKDMARKSASNAFHAIHAPNSWEKTSPEMQDQLYAALLDGSVVWKK